MRILCMLPAGKGVYPQEAEERRLDLMRSYATAATQIDADYMPAVSGFVPWGGTGGYMPAGPGGESGEGEEGMARARTLSAQRALQAERDGYDAFCPYGLLDIGVQEARKLVKIAVVGQAESALLFCGLLGRRFASCTYMPGLEDHIPRLAASLGVEHLYAASTAIGIPNSEYPTRRKELLDRFVACANEAREKGAEIMGFVAMSISPGEYPASELMEASGFPVLDGLACQIALAEWWHRTGLPPSLLRVPRG